MLFDSYRFVTNLSSQMYCTLQILKRKIFQRQRTFERSW